MNEIHDCRGCKHYYTDYEGRDMFEPIKPKCCWKCKHLISYNSEEDKCDLDGHIFEDRLILSSMRDKECPLDKDELKGE